MSDSVSPVVLVVDGHPGVLEVERRGLEAAGFTVQTANTSEEAFRQLEGGDVAVAVIDLGVAVLDDTVLGELLVQAWPGVALLFVTGVPAMAERATLPGPVLRKPYHLSDLVAAVSELAEHAAGSEPAD
jgi:DNA-binding response OmpR family regulator